MARKSGEVTKAELEEADSSLRKAAVEPEGRRIEEILADLEAKLDQQGREISELKSWVQRMVRKGRSFQ